MKEKNAFHFNGFIGVLLIAISLFLGVYLLVQELPGVGIPFILIAALLSSGITIIQPNQAVVVTFFGKY